MKIYIAIIDDKHCDTEAFAFTTPEAAIAKVEGSVPDGEADDRSIPDKSDWIAYASWDSDESSAWAYESELDPEV